jgi:hypothetical protein
LVVKGWSEQSASDLMLFVLGRGACLLLGEMRYIND